MPTISVWQQNIIHAQRSHNTHTNDTAPIKTIIKIQKLTNLHLK